MRPQTILPSLVACAGLSAQTAHNTNFGIKTRVLDAGVAADATYTATQLNLPFVDWTGYGTPTTTLGQTLYGYSLLLSDALYYQSQNNDQVVGGFEDLASALHVSASSLYMFTFMALEVLDTARSANTWYRVYQLYVPVGTTYTVTANLIGGFDRPHNKLDIFRNTTSVFHRDVYLSSNRPMSYPVDLAPGNYTFVVGLGSGSTAFHDAGTLASVLATGNFIWTSTAIVAESHPSFISTLPAIGSTAQVSVAVPASIQEATPYPISFGDGTVTYTNFRAAQAFLSPCKSPDAVLQRIVDGGGQVWFGEVQQEGSSYNQATRTATFTLTRLEDIPWFQ